jgi:murein L,D-transpeptidase YafK
MELIDKTVEQLYSGILIHGMPEKGDDAWTLCRDLLAIGTCFQHVIKMEPCHDDAVNKKHLKLNVEEESKAAMSSLGLQRQAGYQYPPVREPKLPDK